MGKPLKKIELEERRSERIRVRIPVGVYIDGIHGSVDGEILNISMEGAYVQCPRPVKVGEKVLVEIREAGSTILDGKVIPHEIFKAIFSENNPQSSVVRWKKALNQEDEPELTGFGIEFTNLEQEGQDFLKRLIEYYKKVKKAGVKFD